MLGWVGRAARRRAAESPEPPVPVASLLPDPDTVEASSPAAPSSDPDADEVRRRLEDARARLRSAIPPPDEP